MKKLVFLALLIISSVLNAQNFSFSATAPTGQTLYYSLIDEIHVKVVCPDYSQPIRDLYKGYTRPSGDLTIPNTVENKGKQYIVSEIGDSAFVWCNNITSVVISDSIEVIGNSAFFWCDKIRTVTLGKSVRLIDNRAFGCCNGLKKTIYRGTISGWCKIQLKDNPASTSENLYIGGKLLTDLVIPNGVTKIGDDAFHNNLSIKTVTIPATVTEIGNWAFRGCDNIREIKLPNSIKYIGEYSFAYCTGLTEIVLPNSVRSIGRACFSSCNNLTSITFSENIHTIPMEAFCGCESLSHIEIPNTITVIGMFAFSACKELSSVTIPTSVKTIEEAAFSQRFPKIESIFIPSTVSSIGPRAFENIPVVIYGGTAGGSPWGAKKVVKATSPNQKIFKGEQIWSGSGFAISNEYIVTNYHVIDDAVSIEVRGINGDNSTGYIATVAAVDRVNDIAVIKISDPDYKKMGTIPYSITSHMSDVGEDVFVLGYPLTQALGNEIKLTNGIISSRTGYQGDVSTYQISAPIQPGNSGGPMFDSKGNVIGIVVAGVSEAENVGYAIKTSYLKILIESAGLNIRFPANNTVSTLSLTEKVKRVKNFVFYIECSK